MKEFLPRLLLPSLGDFIFVIVFIFLVRLLPDFVFLDGGTGWHLATGRYIVETGRFPYTEFLSYTHFGQPWITQYWLTDLITYLTALMAGLNGVAVVFAALYGWLFLIIYNQCRRAGGGSLFCFLLVLVGACAASVQFLARPIVVSWFLVVAFAARLEDYQQGLVSRTKLWLWLFIASMFWANMHSGYIYGISQVLIYVVCNAVVALFHSDAKARGDGRKKAIDLALALVCVLIGVSLNPYGFGLHENIAQALANKSLIDSVDEFKSPSFHGGIQSFSLELLFFALSAGIYLSKVRLSLPRFLTVLAFAHIALFSVRNVPLFSLVAMPCIAILFTRTRLDEIFGCLTASESPGLARRALEAVLVRLRRVDGQEVLKGYHALPALFVIFYALLCFSGGTIFGEKILDCRFNPNLFPTTTLTAIKDLHLDPQKGFNQYNWGGYIFYLTRMPVYIDDRTTFFGDFSVRYGSIVSLYPGWKDKLKEDGIDWVIFPKGAGLSNALKEDPGWTIVAEDPAAYLFRRTTSDVDIKSTRN